MVSQPFGGHRILCCQSLSCAWPMFSRIPPLSLCPLGASSTLPHSQPPKWSQTWPHVPWGENCLQWRTTAVVLRYLRFCIDTFTSPGSWSWIKCILSFFIEMGLETKVMSGREHSSEIACIYIPRGHRLRQCGANITCTLGLKSLLTLLINLWEADSLLGHYWRSGVTWAVVPEDLKWCLWNFNERTWVTGKLAATQMLV